MCVSSINIYARWTLIARNILVGLQLWVFFLLFFSKVPLFPAIDAQQRPWAAGMLVCAFY